MQCNTDVLVELLRDLSMQTELCRLGGDSGVVVSARVLTVSHQLPRRLFQTWSFKVLEVEAKRPELFEPGMPLSQLVTDLVTVLLKLAVHFSKQLNTKVLAAPCYLLLATASY